MRRILVTNDDGYASPGIQALAAPLRRPVRLDMSVSDALDPVAAEHLDTQPGISEVATK